MQPKMLKNVGRPRAKYSIQFLLCLLFTASSAYLIFRSKCSLVSSPPQPPLTKEWVQRAHSYIEECKQCNSRPGRACADTLEIVVGKHCSIALEFHQYQMGSPLLTCKYVWVGKMIILSAMVDTDSRIDNRIKFQPFYYYFYYYYWKRLAV